MLNTNKSPSHQVLLSRYWEYKHNPYGSDWSSIRKAGLNVALTGSLNWLSASKNSMDKVNPEVKGITIPVVTIVKGKQPNQD
ncbi:hypothetical protein [Myxosarcina sp. GI1]|uniref:hypothetical protein n=1 Tax=Myxosarcina sp. GI1 TaxID=1541065 RepID=UPI000564AA5E|nr:hypothetical protein [Myxosarcina sp. GI1]